MKRSVKILWKRALKGNGAAFRKLGIIFLEGKKCNRDVELARLCIKRSMEMGDQKSFFLYHRLFSKGKQVIDDRSYRDIYFEYGKEKEPTKRKKLKEYLNLGTAHQKEAIRKGRSSITG